jgi:hypothetical protein
MTGFTLQRSTHSQKHKPQKQSHKNNTGNSVPVLQAQGADARPSRTPGRSAVRVGMKIAWGSGTESHSRENEGRKVTGSLCHASRNLTNDRRKTHGENPPKKKIRRRLDPLAKIEKETDRQLSWPALEPTGHHYSRGKEIMDAWQK